MTEKIEIIDSPRPDDTIRLEYLAWGHDPYNSADNFWHMRRICPPEDDPIYEVAP